MIISLPASPWFYRGLNTVLVVLTAWLAAALLWQVFAPRSPMPLPAPDMAPPPVAKVELSALNALFGEGANQTVSLSSLGIKLRGVIATTAPAVAIFEKAGQPAIAVKTDGEIEAGVRLQEVAPDHAIVDNRGRRERIDLDTKPPAAGLTAVRPGQGRPAMAQPGSGGQAPPGRPDQAGGMPPSRAPASAALPSTRQTDSRSLTRQALAAGMQGLNVNDWTRGLVDSEGGVRIDNAAAQPLAGQLGLQSGDVLTSVNGSSLQHTTDISSLYSAFSRANNVTVEILRNGSPISLRYSIESPTAP